MREPSSKRERAADVARTGGSLPAQARPLQALRVEKTHLHDRKIGTKQVVAASRMWSPRRTSSTSSRHRRSDSRSSDRGCCPRVQSFGAWRRSMGSCSTPGISWILESLARVHHYRTHAGISDGARWCARASEPCEAIVVLIARGTQGAWWQSTRRHYVGCISRCHHTDERVLLAVARRSTKPTERAASESSSRSIAQSIDGWMDVDRQRQQQDAQQELLNNQGPDVVVVVASPPND